MKINFSLRFFKGVKSVNCKPMPLITKKKKIERRQRLEERTIYKICLDKFSAKSIFATYIQPMLPVCIFRINDWFSH